MVKKLKIYTSFRSKNTSCEPSDNDSEEVKLLKAIINEKDHERITQSGTVFMQSSAFAEVFNKPLKGTTREQRFIKIKSAETGNTVYRILRAKTGSFELKDILYADNETRDILTSQKPGEMVELEITKSGRLMNYLHNFNLYDRMSFRIALISLFLGVVSLILGIAPFIR